MNITDVTNQITITESAIRKISDIVKEEKNEQLKLRIFISGGGCSGFQYGFTLDDLTNEDDLLFEKEFLNADKSVEKVQFIVDNMSINYLQNAEIDYTDDLNGAQFIVKNPNATTTCGCGSSFSV